MFGLYLFGYVAVAGLFYLRAYRTAPLVEEEFGVPSLTLWVNPEMELSGETETWRKAA